MPANKLRCVDTSVYSGLSGCTLGQALGVQIGIQTYFKTAQRGGYRIKNPCFRICTGIEIRSNISYSHPIDEEQDHMFIIESGTPHLY